PDAYTPGLDDVEVDAEVELLPVAQAAVALDPRERVERAHSGIGILRRHGAARHGPGDAHDRLPDPHALPRVLLVRARAAELDLARDLAPVGEAQRQRAVLRLRSDPHELPVVLAVVEAPALDQVVTPVRLDATLGQLDLLRVQEPEPLHGCDVDPRDGRHL